MFLSQTVHPQKISQHNVCIAKADSGASNHFWREKDAHILDHIKEEIGPPVKLPNSETINDNKVGSLPNLSKLSSAAKKVRILKDLHSSNLLSLGQLADDGCTTEISQHDLIIKKE